MTIFTVILPHIYPFPCNKSIWNILQGRRVISHSFFTDLLSFKMIRNKLQKRRIYLNSFNAHFLCFKMVRDMVKCTGMVCIILLHFSCIQRWSGTLNIMHSLLHSASLHISWVLKRSGTYASESGFMGTALLHISCVLRYPGISLIQLGTFSKDIILFIPLGLGEGQILWSFLITFITLIFMVLFIAKV